MGKPRSDTSQSRSKSDKPSESGRNKTGPRAGAGDRPKSSKEYSAKQLKGTGKENFETQRKRHTQAAEQRARREVAKATGKDPKEIKIAGKEKGVQQHHHRDVSTGRRLQVNPKVVGEKGTFSAVDTRRGGKNFASEGKRPNWNPSEHKRVTHHGQAARIDRYERERTAKAAGAKDGKPPSDAARRAYVDGSNTGKARWPATGDQTERAKQKWEYKEPKGPKLDDKGRVIRDQPKLPRSDGPRGGPPKGGVPEGGVPKGGVPEGGGPKGVPRGDLPKGPGKGWDVVGRLGRFGRALGIIGNIFSTKRDIERIIAEDKPELLREGQKVPLDKPISRDNPFMRVPSGYTVEKTGGEIIYRNSKGGQVSKDEALGASDPYYWIGKTI